MSTSRARALNDFPLMSTMYSPFGRAANPDAGVARLENLRTLATVLGGDLRTIASFSGSCGSRPAVSKSPRLSINAQIQSRV